MDFGNFIIKYDNILILILTLFLFAIAYRQYKERLSEKYKVRLLEKSFGSDLFGREIIETSTISYIRPFCTSTDPSYGSELDRTIGVIEDIYDVIDRFLSLKKGNDLQRHLLLLADSGMGKTSFFINYCVRNQKLNRKKRYKIAIIPLGIKEPEKYIRKIKNQSDTILFLDAFDEDIKAQIECNKRLMELMEERQHFRRIILTCRTHFFPKMKKYQLKQELRSMGHDKLVKGQCMSFGDYT